MVDVEAFPVQQIGFDGCGGQPRTPRALVFHDRVTVAMALSRSIQQVDPVRAVDCFDDGFALADAFGRDPAAAVLVGYRSGSTAAAEATGRLLGRFPAAPVIAYGSADCAPLLVAAVSGGVRAVLLWNPDEPVVRRPAPLARRGHPAANGGGTRTTLTAPEREILSQIAEGCSNHEIGRTLSLSDDAVKTRARSIYRKLGARDRAHAVALGIRLNYLT